MPKNPPIAKLKNQPRKYKNIKGDVIHSYQWTKCRASYLELYPICQRCQYLNQVTHASVYKLSVHHIRGRIKYPELVFDESNLLTLCSGCHNGYFTKLEDAGKENQAIQEGEEIKLYHNRTGVSF